MKYTRYDLKRKNTDGIWFATVFIGILLLAFFIGTIVSKVVYRNNNNDTVNTVKPSGVKEIQKPAGDGGRVKFIAIQGGMYKVKENADTMKNTLAEYGNPFIISEQDKAMRVFLGIFTEEETVKRVKELTDKSVANSKMTFEVNNNNDSMAEIIAIINGNIQVLTKLTDKTVQSVKVEEFKKWCEDLKAVDKSSSNYNELNELKEYVRNLPKEISREKAAENYVFIYNLLKKLTL